MVGTIKNIAKICKIFNTVARRAPFCISSDRLGKLCRIFFKLGEIVHLDETICWVENFEKILLLWRAAGLGVNLVQAPYLHIENRY